MRRVEGSAEGCSLPRSRALLKGDCHAAAGPQPHLLMHTRCCVHRAPGAQNKHANQHPHEETEPLAIIMNNKGTPFHAQAKLVAKQHDKTAAPLIPTTPCQWQCTHTLGLQGAWMTSQREGGSCCVCGKCPGPFPLWRSDRTSVARQVERRPCQQTHQTTDSLLQQPAMAVEHVTGHTQHSLLRVAHHSCVTNAGGR